MVERITSLGRPILGASGPETSRPGLTRRHRVRIAVAVAEEALACIGEVARACRELGFKHDSTLSSVGVLTGFVEEESIPRLRAVSGVTAVEVERDIRIGWPKPDYLT